MNSTEEIREVTLQNGRYNMRVANIVESRKSFPSNNVTRHVHDIYFINDSDNTGYRGELITTSSRQGDFIVGNVYCFEVINAIRREIVPCGLAAKANGFDTSTATNSNDEDDEFSPNVAGKSYAVAMGFATQIAVARIRIGDLTGTENDFMDIIKGYAWDMHQWLLDPKPVKSEPPLPF